MPDRHAALIARLRDAVLGSPGATDPALRQAHISDEAMEDMVGVCVAFNLIDRVADSLGFILATQEESRRAARLLLTVGYR